MTNAEFDVVLASRLKKIDTTLGVKALEYVRNGDRLHNFNRGAAICGVTPERALLGYWLKHIVSVIDLVDDLDSGKNAPLKLWDEKIGDAINYLVLLEACVVERSKEKKSKSNGEGV